jgi:hypothetical protein
MFPKWSFEWIQEWPLLFHLIITSFVMKLKFKIRMVYGKKDVLEPLNVARVKERYKEGEKYSVNVHIYQ